MLKVQQLTKTYSGAAGALTVLDHVDFHIPKGSTAAIVGPSGSGKTTLLGLCAGLDAATSGDVLLNGSSLSSMSEDQRAEHRGKFVGFIFQNFQLLPSLTAVENVMVPLELQGSKDAKQAAKEWLTKVGLSDRMHHYPTQLSGGEQQRVAIARAFVNNPEILFADEPTGNLDDTTSETIEELLFGLNKESGTTLVMVTHDNELAKKTDRILKIKGGQLIES